MRDERQAAMRVGKALVDAAAGNYVGAWYFYVDRKDVEALMLAPLSDTERAVYRRLLEEASGA